VGSASSVSHASFSPGSHSALTAFLVSRASSPGTNSLHSARVSGLSAPFVSRASSPSGNSGSVQDDSAHSHQGSVSLTPVLFSALLTLLAMTSDDFVSFLHDALVGFS